MAASTVIADRSSLTFSAKGASGTVLKNRAQTFRFGPEEFRIATEGFFIKDLQLWSGWDLLATARRGTFGYAGGLWKLKCARRWTEVEYRLFQNKDLVGWIRSPRSWHSILLGVTLRDFEQVVIDLPDELPGVVKLFLAWTACYLWTQIDGVSSGD